MSPEQLRGGADLDGRTDVWSLGVILFELVTGEGAFDAPTLPEMCVRILSEPARKISEARPDISFPEGFEDVVNLCLAKDPKSRFADTVDLAIALGPFVEASSATPSNLPTKAPPTGLRDAPIDVTNVRPAPPIAQLIEVDAAVTIPDEPARPRSRRALVIVAACVAFVALSIVVAFAIHVGSPTAVAPPVASTSSLPSAIPSSVVVVPNAPVASVVASTTPSTTPKLIVVSSARSSGARSPPMPTPNGDEFGGRK